MRPLKLEFKGINSFSEHTIIDFESLTKTGIFGIFGDTGSGKSTILDCINFALYGNVKRSEIKTDIINYRCPSAEVKFSFNINNEGKRKTYTIERVLKKDKNGTHKAMLYENDGEREVCIADKASSVEKKIEEILGVGDEDFRKCIALPQGEFAQFVKSTPSVRLAIIERLFSLSKYGDRLKEKLGLRQRAVEDEYQNLSGRLKGYEDVSAEELKILEKSVSNDKKRLKKLSAEAKTAADSYEKANFLNEKRLELEKTVELIDKLGAEKQRINELREGLAVLPACKEAVKFNEDACKKRADSKTYGTEAEIFSKKAEVEAAKARALEENLKNGNFDEKISERMALAAHFQACSDKPDKLKEVVAQLDLKRAEFKKKEEELNKIISDKAKADEAAALAEQELENFDGGDLQQLFDSQFKGAVLREEYIANLDYFALLNGKIEEYEDGSPLYSFISEETRNKLNEYKARAADVKDFNLSDVKAKIEGFQKNGELRDKMRKILSERREALHKLSSAEELCKSELNTIRREGEQLRLRADELRKELAAVFGDKTSDFAEAVKGNCAALEKLKEQKRQITEELEKSRDAKNLYVLSAEKNKTLAMSSLTEAENIEKRLETILAENGFENVEGCVKIVTRFMDAGNAEQALKEYDGKLIALRERRAELEKAAGIFEVSDACVTSAKAEKERLDKEINVLTGEIAVKDSQYSAGEKRLNEKNALLKEFSAVEKQRNLLSQLKDITKNNKFLEFIANEYLCDVSSLATATLLKLTDGRYFLEYKENSFYVGDNFDCGNLRGVNTLSGGETFLVSLSLALALSQTICARSMKSIEFFFLDEGFGTLDSTLVDTVMNALEKLKSSNFTIGVISHVEELKHRIESKITVIKATESRGSTVRVSC